MENFKPSSILLLITNDCNLKCIGCIHGCDIISEKYYISLKDLEIQLKILKEKNFQLNKQPIKIFRITGGEPFLHPYLIEICKLIKNYFPNNHLEIATNGILLNKYSKQKLIELKTLNCSIQFSLYPFIDNAPEFYKKIFQQLDKLKIKYNIEKTHFYFNKSTIKQEFLNEKINTMSCKQSFLINNFVMLYKNQLFPCGKNILLNNAINKIGITVTELPDNQDLINLLYNDNINIFCKNCLNNIKQSEGNDWVLWQPKNKKNIKKILTSTLCELYCNDYELYYDLAHNCYNHYKCLNDNLFIKYFDDHNPTEYYKTTTRFLEQFGKLDIFIPFINYFDYNKITQLLLNQSIISKCNLYFISINSNTHFEKIIYNTFHPDIHTNFNSFFLKSTSILQAYKTFIKNSYLPKKILLNIYNERTLDNLKNPNYLLNLI